MAERVDGRFRGWLIASDYDGTLADSTGRVPDDVKTALKRFISGGGLFTVSTGRSYLGFHAYDSDVINAPVLLANGGMAYDYKRKRVVIDACIQSEGIAPMRAVAEAFPTLAIELYAFDMAYSIHMNARSERHFTSQDIPFQKIDDPAQAPGPWMKAMLGGDEEEITRAQKFLQERYPEIAFLPTTGRYLEILKKGVNKGATLTALSQKLGVSPARVCAVGDGYNDVDMLIAAGHAFAPINGDTLAQNSANHIVRSNDDGCITNVIEIVESLAARGE